MRRHERRRGHNANRQKILMRHAARLTARAETQRACPLRMDCAGAAVTVFAAGKRRRASARAQFLLHASAIEPQKRERWTARELEVHLRVVRQTDEEGLACLMRACGRSAEAISALMTDRRESADLMRAIGLVTDIIDPSPDGVAGIERAWVDSAIAERAHATQKRSRQTRLTPDDENRLKWFSEQQRAAAENVAQSIRQMMCLSQAFARRPRLDKTGEPWRGVLPARQRTS